MVEHMTDVQTHCECGSAECGQLIVVRWEDIAPYKNLRGVFAVSDLCEKTIYIEARLLARCSGYKLFLRLGEPMTLHDRERMERAVRAKHATYESAEEEVAALRAAIDGLGQTSDPGLYALHDELILRYQRLAIKMQQPTQGGPHDPISGEEDHHEADR